MPTLEIHLSFGLGKLYSSVSWSKTESRIESGHAFREVEDSKLLRQCAGTECWFKIGKDVQCD